MNAELLLDCRCLLGEGPLWHPDEQALYWVDIEGRAVHRWDADSGKHQTYDVGQRTGGMTLQADGSLVLFGDHGSVRRWRPGMEPEVLLEAMPDEQGTRCNDVIADPMGRVFVGTMPKADRQGRLYRLDPDLTLTVVLEGVGCSNGMGFTPDRAAMYYIDTPTGRVDRFEYAIETGELTDRRPFFTIPEGAGHPDGMTVDAEGNLWVALWDGSGVLQISASGELLGKVEVAARNVTCPAFGGPNLDELYITSSKYGDNVPETSGSLFRVRPSVGGVAEFRSRIKLA